MEGEKNVTVTVTVTVSVTVNVTQVVVRDVQSVKL